jgi:hypothetical protein
MLTDNTAVFGGACKWSYKKGDANGQRMGDERTRNVHTEI